MMKKSDNIKIIILGITISLIAFAFTFTYEVEKEKLRFASSTEKLLNRVENIFLTIERANSELSSRFYLPSEINKDDFKFFTSTLIKQNNYIQNIMFSKSIMLENKLEYEKNLQYKGYTGFKIKPFSNGKPYKYPASEFLLPIKFIEPYTVKNSRLFGLNLFTHPTLFSLLKEPASEKLIYKQDSNDKNTFYAISLLYRGFANILHKKSLFELYGVLSYKINLDITNEYLYSLSVKTNNQTIFKKEQRNNSLFNIALRQIKEINLNSQNITVDLEQRKSFFSINITYPLIVLLLTLLLTGFIWNIINSHERINLLLKKQKNMIENEVEIKTEELRTKADELTIALNQQLALTDELEAFSYSVSHDLRAPLHSIDGFSQLLKVSYSNTLNAEANDYIERINTASRKMEKIINNLLSLSHISRSNIKTIKCNISEIAERSMDSIRDYEPEKKITLQIEKNIYANVDPNFIEICFDNLFSNAWKYSSKVDSPHIEFATMQKDGETIYYIKDNGVGFNMCDSDKLFTPFQRLHKDSEFDGTGIGLMTVQRIIQKHNGRIWAKSKPDNGATFYFSFNTA